MTWGLWVKHQQVEDYLRLGWMVAIPDRLVSHDYWSVLCVWICDCEVRRPELLEGGGE